MLEKHICELCNREVPRITEHHLIPKARGGKYYDTAMFCTMCHTQIHALYSNRELAARLFSLPRLKSDENIKKYLNFITKMPGETIIPIKKAKNRRY
ncbi:MAG: HNH endonuclease [Clostridium sp.]|uniref:HNH endonuclease n=1 Tax=Clostridium sp. TaxID=1506 RepID=UPI002FC72EA4